VDVTDNSGTPARGAWRPQGWHGVLAAGLTVFTAASVVLVTHTADPASADTYVTSVRNAVIRLANGTEQIAQIGAVLPRGAQLRTGQEGGAELSTAGRNVYVGALSTVDVLDGVRQSLSRGQLMVDSRKGPRLQLATDAGAVVARAGALVRVERRAFVLRLGVFSGSADITASGRRAITPVAALHQVQVNYGAPAGAVKPLALTDDRWETLLVGDLVSADQDLNHLAASLGGNDGKAFLTAAPVAFRVPAAAPGPALGEQVLEVALAQAATKGPGGAAATLSFVQTAYADGGSWGVVAALVGARVTAVSALLDAALTPGGPPPTAVIAGPVGNLPGIFGPPATAGPTTPTGRPQVRPTVTPTRTPPSGPPPSSASPGVVDGLVATVLRLLPLPTTAPAAHVPAAPTPVATPTPLIGLNLNLGGH
jgi:hypothetical protein